MTKQERQHYEEMFTKRAMPVIRTIVLKKMGREHCDTREDIEDAIQDCAGWVWKYIHCHDPKRGKFEGYVARLTLNMLNGQVLKKKIKHRHTKMALLEHNETLDMLEEEMYRIHPEVDMDMREAIQSLPKKLQEPAYLRFIFNMPWEGIMKICKCQRKTAIKRVTEAKKILEDSYVFVDLNLDDDNQT